MTALNSVTGTQITNEQYADDTATVEGTFDGLQSATQILKKKIL